MFELFIGEFFAEFSVFSKFTIILFFGLDFKFSAFSKAFWLDFLKEITNSLISMGKGQYQCKHVLDTTFFRIYW